MPLDSFASDESAIENVSIVYPEIASYNLRAVGGAKFEHWDFQFVARDNDALFAEMPEGAFATDEDKEGLNWTFRKINGQRYYFVYDVVARAYVAAEIAKLRPVIVRGSELPVATEEMPLFAGRQIIFLITGNVDGREVESGGTAYVGENVDVGNKPTWDNLAYNTPTNTVEVAPIELVQAVRLDGSASNTAAPSEKAVADALNAAIADYNAKVAALDAKTAKADSDLSGEVARLNSEVDAVEESVKAQQVVIDSQEVRIIEATEVNKAQDSRLDVIEGRGYEVSESHQVGDGISQTFRIKLDYKYINPQIRSVRVDWSHLQGKKYIPTIPQDGHVERDESTGDCYLVCAFAGIMANNAWEVTVTGRTLGRSLMEEVSAAIS